MHQPLRYNGNDVSELAIKEWPRVLRRIANVGAPIAVWLALVNIDEAMGKAKDPERMKILAKKLREMLTSLGPTYIKIGQALSNRYI